MKGPTISRDFLHDFFGKWILRFAEVCFNPETEILIYVVIKGIEKIVKTQQVKPIHKIKQRPGILRTFVTTLDYQQKYHIFCRKAKNYFLKG